VPVVDCVVLTPDHVVRVWVMGHVMSAHCTATPVLNLPAEHAVHWAVALVAPAGAAWPGGQLVAKHALLSVALLYLPAAQDVHTLKAFVALPAVGSNPAAQLTVVWAAHALPETE